MDLDKQNDPTEKDIKFILDLLNSDKLVDAKKAVDQKLIILFF